MVDVLEVRVAVAAAEAVGLVDGDDAQPGEDRGAVGLAAQQDRPGGLAGVFDQLARGVDGAGDGALEVAVVAAVEVGLVAARRCGCGGGGHGGLRSVGLLAPRLAGDAGRRPAHGRVHAVWPAGSPDTWGGEQPRPRGRSARRSGRPL